MDPVASGSSIALHYLSLTAPSLSFFHSFIQQMFVETCVLGPIEKHSPQLPSHPLASNQTHWSFLSLSPTWPRPGLSGTHLSRVSVPMVSACAAILPHMDTTMVLSALVRDMVVSKLELGLIRTGLCAAQPPGSAYIHGVPVGARLWELGVGSLIRSSNNGWSEPGGTGGVRSYHACPPSWVLAGALATA